MEVQAGLGIECETLFKNYLKKKDLGHGTNDRAPD
jgi:hypothetical protein